MKIGDKVQINIFRNKNGKPIFGGEKGIVTDIIPHNPKNPVEEHGMVEVKFTELSKLSKLKIGECEHYCEYNWQSSMKIIDE